MACCLYSSETTLVLHQTGSVTLFKNIPGRTSRGQPYSSHKSHHHSISLGDCIILNILTV